MKSPLALLAMFLVLTPALAAGNPWPVVPPVLTASSPKAVQDVIFFGDTRPVLVRLHILIDGQPYRQAWDSYFEGLFGYLDRDGDGVLSKQEAERAPKAQQLLQEVQGTALNQLPGGAATLPEILGKSKETKVTREALRAYYRRSNVRPLRLNFPNFQPQAEQITRGLLGKLDVNADERLSREELERAAASLRKLDLDDDEVVTTQEVLGDPFGGFGIVVQPVGGQPGSTATAFLVLEPGEQSHQLITLLLANYDRDKNGKLTPREVGLEKTTFERLDGNRDGVLERNELAGANPKRRDLRAYWPPDLRFLLQVSREVGKEWTVTPYSPDRQPAPLAKAVSVKGKGAFHLALAGSSIDWTLGRALNQSAARNVRRFYVGQLETARTGGKKHVEEAEVQPSRFQFLRGLFRLADRNGDGKLTEEELSGYLDLQARATGTALTLTITDQGRQLLPLLDVNRDGRLGPRELRAAWTNLALLDQDRNGQIDRGELLRRFQIALGPVQQRQQHGQFAVVPPAVMRNPQARPARSGPTWFRKMDRNGDGDISVREFLGDPEDFRRMDPDGDGLISLQEAQQAETALRKR